MNAADTKAAFIKAGNNAEAETADQFLALTGLDGTAFIEEVQRYCDDIDVAGTAGDIAVGYHLAKVLEARNGP